MPETPRTWTLKRFPPSIGGPRETRVAGAVLKDGEEVEVIEKAPVDAERKRMLDLIQSLVGNLVIAGVTSPPRDRAEALLREHGRLGES